MITIKLKEIAEKMGKSISDIARETGLNRNTITAIFHNKIDGIKFDTLEKLCSKYKIQPADLFKISTEEKKVQTSHDLTTAFYEPYRQEGDIIPFTAIPAFLGFESQPTDWFGDFTTHHLGFFKRNYMKVYWDKKIMLDFSKQVYKRYNDKKELEKLFDEFNIHANAIKNIYLSHSADEILNYSAEEIVSFTKEIFDAYAGFWQMSLFIDSFDAGFDVKKTEEIKRQFALTAEEVSTLTTPEVMTFNNERLLKLYEIVKKIIKNKLQQKPAKIKEYLSRSKDVAKYILDFDYYKSNYAHMNHITLDEIFDEVEQCLCDKDWKKKCEEIKRYEKTVKANIDAVLKKHNLKQNPLFFFQKLVFWREYRKQINLMGIHSMHYVLKAIEIKASIPYEYLKHIVFDEVPNVLKGLISLNQLKKRYEHGMMISTVGGGYKIIEGAEAQSISDEMEKRILGQAPEKILSGQVACQGYVKGIARIILGQEDFHKFNEGEILVTGMTRPEFIQLMKKASAIVTNEGGITCHAAIVSRELGKPCIIGTQRATQMIKDGDLIEVRANHGTVRILS
ncbi:MAG: PEP-utilizing enzyme [Candidatus Paceibacterota bacterium]|jgi:phosphohistidine swiveling domain-containing protein/DNA-binding Xre family transcriptional regulator